jgi:hypothetical protein
MSSPTTSGTPDLRYPIGQFERPAVVSLSDLKMWIASIESLPSDLAQAVAGLSEAQLDTPYRPAGWTVRQVVHHVADSHTQSVTRFRLALTEENPTIKPYAEFDWAELPDAKSAPIELSLDLLRTLHARWVMLLRSLSRDQFSRRFQHPEIGEVQLDWVTGHYAWHGRHHVAHITALRDRQGWAS